MKYCNTCKKLVNVQSKCSCGNYVFNCTLIKPDDDNFIKRSEKVLFLQYNDVGKIVSTLSTPIINYGLIMSPFSYNFTWHTTPIVEIIEEKIISDTNYLKFRTENSLYELYYIETLPIQIQKCKMKDD